MEERKVSGWQESRGDGGETMEEKGEEEEGWRVKWRDYSVISTRADGEAEGHNYSEQTLSHDPDFRRFKVFRTTTITC